MTSWHMPRNSVKMMSDMLKCFLPALSTYERRFWLLELIFLTHCAWNNAISSLHLCHYAHACHLLSHFTETSIRAYRISPPQSPAVSPSPTICFRPFNTIFVSSHMYPENPERTQVIVGFMNMGYDIYLTLPGSELTTSSVSSSCRFH